MKTPAKNRSKSFTLILGVVVAIIAGMSATVNAHNLPYTNNVEHICNDTAHQIPIHFQPPDGVEIYDQHLELIYKGTVQNIDQESQSLINRSALIMKDDQTSFYLINEL